jgi:putative colanic acid biosynthesis UDP-glucose lipid carrier transferase
VSGVGDGPAGGESEAVAVMNAPLHPATSRPAVGAASYLYTPEKLPGLFRVIDLSMIVLAAVVAQIPTGFPVYGALEYYVFAVFFCCVLFDFAAGRTTLYSPETLMRYGGRFDDLLLANFVALMMFLSVTTALHAVEKYDPLWIALFSCGSFALQAAARLVGCRILRRMAARRLIGRNMAVLGVGEQARRFLRRLDVAKPFFTTVVGVFDPDPAASDDRTFEGRPVRAGLDALLAAVRRGEIEDVVVTMPWNADRQVADAVERLKELPINVYLSTDLVGFELAFRPVTGDLADLPVFEVVQRPISGWSSTLKALEDKILATLAILLISPLLIVVAIAIKLDTPGPVFFKQRRLGFNNREFEIYKFRSMRHRAQPEARTPQASRNDPRITRVGRIIRKTSIDELPQLFNVLNGTMSLVGPRPHALDHNEEYSRQIRGYFARHKVKPGITGWAQVNGLRGETETLDKMEARIRHDVYYAENWSLFFDIRILIQTVLVVLFQRSAY